MASEAEAFVWHFLNDYDLTDDPGRPELGNAAVVPAQPEASAGHEELRRPLSTVEIGDDLFTPDNGLPAQSSLAQLHEPREPLPAAEGLTPLTAGQAAYCQWWLDYLHTRPYGYFAPQDVNHTFEPRFAHQLYELVMQYAAGPNAGSHPKITDRAQVERNLRVYYHDHPARRETTAYEDRERIAAQNERLGAVRAHLYFRPDLQALTAIIRALYEDGRKSGGHKNKHATRAAFAVLTAIGMTLKDQ